MKLLKIISIFIAIYFVRRFIQLYKAMKQIQDDQAKAQASHQNPSQSTQRNTINADFKVVD